MQRVLTLCMLEENCAGVEAHQRRAIVFYFVNKLSICFDLHDVLRKRDYLINFLLFLFHLHLEIITFNI